MKKYILLILSILLFVVTFIVRWFDDTLFDRFFILGIIPFIILIQLYIALLVVTIIFLIKKKWYVNFVTIVVLVLIVMMIMFFPFRYTKTKLEASIFEKDRMDVIQMIKNDGSSGNYNLPSGYGNLSSDGRQAYVHWNDGDEQVVGFWVFRGLLSGSAQVIYSTGGEDLIMKHISLHEVSKINKLKENWYYVEMDMDD